MKTATTKMANTSARRMLDTASAIFVIEVIGIAAI
jgi:hypothetical protein